MFPKMARTDLTQFTKVTINDNKINFRTRTKCKCESQQDV